MNELKLCPFCGADPINLEFGMDRENGNKEFYIYCYGCDMIYYNGNSFKGAGEFIRKFNMRVRE